MDPIANGHAEIIHALQMGSWILSAVALGLLGLVFFVMRYWVEQQAVRIDKLVKDCDKRFTKICNDIDKLSISVKERFMEAKQERLVLEDTLMRADMHKAVCKETQAQFMLHVSNELRNVTVELLKEIKSNREAVEDLVNKIRSDLNENGHMKR